MIGNSSHGENTKRKIPAIAAAIAMSREKLRPETVPAELATVPAAAVKPP
jgi:hypothetical protein